MLEPKVEGLQIESHDRLTVPDIRPDCAEIEIPNHPHAVSRILVGIGGGIEECLGQVALAVFLQGFGKDSRTQAVVVIRHMENHVRQMFIVHCAKGTGFSIQAGPDRLHIYSTFPVSWLNFSIVLL
jgi:chemotaxis response regulator CheB